MRGFEVHEPESKIRVLTRTLNNQKIPWCILNDEEQLRHPAPGADLDIWCASAQPMRLLIELSLLGWTVRSGRCFGQPDTRNFACTLRLQSDDEAYPRLLDISFGNLRTGVFVYSSASADISEEPNDASMRFLRMEKTLARLVTRTALRNTLTAAHLARGRELWRAFSETQRDSWRVDTEQNIGQHARKFLEGALKNPGREIGCFRIQLHAFVHTYLLQPRNLANFLRWAQSKSRSFKRNIIIYLIGTDGSGKSTTAHLLMDHWRAKHHDDRATYHYWGRGRSNFPIVSFIRGIVLRMKRSPDTKRNTDAIADQGSEQGAGQVLPDRDSPGHMSGTIGLFVYIVEYWFRRLRLAFVAGPSALQIIDRGPPDLKVMYDAHPWARKLWRLGPRADIVVLCHAADTVILNRKRERSAKVVGQHLQDYHTVLGIVRKGNRFAYALDTEQGKKESLNEILCVIHVIRCWKSGNLDTRVAKWILSQDQTGKA